MLTIHLHIGRGKTGTTTIQRWLAANREGLLRHDADYLLADDRGRGCGHQQFAKSFIANPPGFMVPAKRPEDVRREIFDELCETRASHAIISSENFPLADVSEVAGFFRNLPVDHRVKIVFFARSQDELAESEYNQMVKLKRVTESFSSYVENSLDGCHFDSEMAFWERHFGRENLVCRIYDAGRKDVVAPFLAAISDDLADFSGAEVPANSGAANIAIGMKALSAIRLLNEIELVDRQTVYQRIIDGFAGVDLPALFLDSEAAARLRSRFAESNRSFTERYLGRAFADFGGRRRSDEERDTVMAQLIALGLPSN